MRKPSNVALAVKLTHAADLLSEAVRASLSGKDEDALSAIRMAQGLLGEI